MWSVRRVLVAKGCGLLGCGLVSKDVIIVSKGAVIAKDVTMVLLWTIVTSLATTTPLAIP